MRTLIISQADCEIGRGPVHRLSNVLPELVRYCDLSLLSMGRPDRNLITRLKLCGISVREAPLQTFGWFLRDPKGHVDSVLSFIKIQRPDLVVLYWEAWDLWRCLAAALKRIGVPFAVMAHGMPFLNAPARPTRSFHFDVLRHSILECELHEMAFNILKFREAKRLLSETPIIVINETIEMYLNRYFSDLKLFRAVPGYAVKVDPEQSLGQSTPKFAFSFLAKLVKEKGVFEIPRILRLLQKKTGNVKTVIIGSFESPRSEGRFMRDIESDGLAKHITMTGWVSETEKHKLLRDSRVFLYPSLYGDTFSIALLEALAAGLPAVCYQVPFVETIYKTEAVTVVPLRDRVSFSLAAVTALHKAQKFRLQALKFAGNYSEWSVVAKREYEAYCSILSAGIR